MCGGIILYIIYIIQNTEYRGGTFVVCTVYTWCTCVPHVYCSMYSNYHFTIRENLKKDLFFIISRRGVPGYGYF